VFGIVIALFLGISASYWAGCVAYVLAAASMIVITRRGAADAPVPGVAPPEEAPVLEEAPA
jgi:hypothetical protein